jgi:hypothetical protein
LLCGKVGSVSLKAVTVALELGVKSSEYKTCIHEYKQGQLRVVHRAVAGALLLVVH